MSVSSDRLRRGAHLVVRSSLRDREGVFVEFLDHLGVVLAREYVERPEPRELAADSSDPAESED